MPRPRPHVAGAARPSGSPSVENGAELRRTGLGPAALEVAGVGTTERVDPGLMRASSLRRQSMPRPSVFCARRGTRRPTSVALGVAIRRPPPTKQLRLHPPREPRGWTISRSAPFCAPLTPTPTGRTGRSAVATGPERRPLGPPGTAFPRDWPPMAAKRDSSRRARPSRRSRSSARLHRPHSSAMPGWPAAGDRSRDQRAGADHPAVTLLPSTFSKPRRPPGPRAYRLKVHNGASSERKAK